MTPDDFISAELEELSAIEDVLQQNTRLLEDVAAYVSEVQRGIVRYFQSQRLYFDGGHGQSSPERSADDLRVTLGTLCQRIFLPPRREALDAAFACIKPCLSSQPAGAPG